MNNVSGTSQCPKCGAPLSANAVQGLCPRCLIAANLAGDTQFTEPGANRPDQPLALPEIARLFPQLEIVRLVGRGGMGAVYQARQPALDRFVALKLLTPPPDADTHAFAERFTREARALARLNHNNIVTVYDFGEREGHYFLLMEFVDGVTLRELIEQKAITPPQALAIVPKVCDALQFAHEQGVVHRDIKPENILLDRRSNVKIADFGIAKIINPSAPTTQLTGASDRMGTPHYMAPEQIERSMTVDHRADIYSLGVVFYELLTGELPLGRFSPPSQRVQIDVRLDEVVLRTLEKEPARRFQHVSEVKTRVETIVATPNESASHARRRRARWPWFVGAAAVVALTIGTIFFYRKAPQATASTGIFEDVRPHVISTWPKTGDIDVPSGEIVLSVTFNKPMNPATYTWGYAWADSNAKMIGTPYFSADHRTCYNKVLAEPGKRYGYMLNTGGKYNNFRDEAGTPSVPYLLIFSTRNDSDKKSSESNKTTP